MGLRAVPLQNGFFSPGQRCSAQKFPLQYRRSKVVVMSSSNGEKEEEKVKKIRKQNLFESVTEALDFSQVRSAEDAALLDQAREATRSGDKMSREQVIIYFIFIF